ncbi:MAG: GNAT family N-acetyltransferase, partial [Verrucomicrobia bacterium]|nr:GNAT family N-acetyltransferase [Verrucomicrobiota bacterium]
MEKPDLVTLEDYDIRLEPLALDHHDGLVAAASDGNLWELWFASVPKPQEVKAYIAKALEGQEAGNMLAWAVRDLSSQTIVGSTRYHDILTPIDRVEIGSTWLYFPR